MNPLVPLKEKPSLAGYKKGDYLVLFGELFQRGYANGLVEEAERRGVTIIRSTVGRRDKDGTLRPLNEEELALHSGPVINVPLEAGFDMQPDSKGNTPVDALRDVKLNEWKDLRLDATSIEESKQRGQQDFQARVKQWLVEVEKVIEPGRNVLFAHLMAGGVPRAKIVMPLMNRVFKGRGDRYLSSEEFWQTDIGKLCETSFFEVTAETFRHLVELSTSLREKLEQKGGQVSYVAFGYHGTEVWLRDAYRWTTHTPYLQGWAKRRLEDHSRAFHKQGLRTCVYNCPEILTNSSSVFQGVELFLYLLLEALQKEAPNNPRVQTTLSTCQGLLQNGIALSDIYERLLSYFDQPEIIDRTKFDLWPQHSTQLQLEKMLNESDLLISWHQDEKNLMTAVLSEVVFEGCGFAMFHDSWKPAEPVRWLGHSVVARCYPEQAA